MNNSPQDELDERLKHLAIVAQRYPPQSKDRWLACTKLVQEIQKSRMLCRPNASRFPRDLYEEIYDVARQEILTHVFQKIDEYKSEKAVMQWINLLMKKRFFPKAISEVLGRHAIKIPEMTDLDNILAHIALNEARPLLSEIAREYIEEDPEGLFKKEHMKSHLEVNFQILALQWLSGLSWGEIFSEFGIKVSSISRFLYRCLDKFAANFRDYLKE